MLARMRSLLQINFFTGNKYPQFKFKAIQFTAALIFLMGKLPFLSISSNSKPFTDYLLVSSLKLG